DFFNRITFDAIKKLGNMELFGTDAVDRRESSAQYVVGACVLTSTFERNNIKRSFDYRNLPSVAGRVAVERRNLLGGVNESKCDWTDCDIVVQICNCRGKLCR